MLMAQPGAIQDLYFGVVPTAMPASQITATVTQRPLELTIDQFAAWRVNFINPAAAETSAQLIARRDSDGVMMEGKLANGTAIRWRYRQTTANSFHYTAAKNEDNSWKVYLELFGQRTV
jgi:hypothetical protein